MKDRITTQLLDASRRLTEKELFGNDGDSFSMRVPGTSDIVWIRDGVSEPQTSALSSADDGLALHADIYRLRPDAGALLLSTTVWSEQLAAIQRSPPILFDEQARHIGPVAAPVSATDNKGLAAAAMRGSNAAIFGKQSLRIGMTRDRVVFNAELFEKCAMAFVLAISSGQPIKTIPAWVRYIAGRRLKKDQKRAAVAYANGEVPEGMNAY